MYNWSIRDVELILTNYNYEEVQRTAMASGYPGFIFNIKFSNKLEAERFFQENHKKPRLWTRPSIKTPVNFNDIKKKNSN